MFSRMSSAALLGDDIQISRDLDTVVIKLHDLEKHSRPGHVRSEVKIRCGGPCPELNIGDAIEDYLSSTHSHRLKVFSPWLLTFIIRHLHVEAMY